MKKIIIAFAAGLTIWLSACMDDKGNYDYLDPKDVAPQILSTLEDSYDLISLDKLTINPEVSGNESDYNYLWYAYSAQNNSLDTIGHEKALNYEVVLPNGTYTLVLKVENKENKTSAFLHSTLYVSSIFGRGFFVVKEADGNTDIDFVDRNGAVNQDILKTINGSSIPGKPINSTYCTTMSGVGYSYQVTNPDNTITLIENKPAMFMATDQELYIYQGESMKLLETFDDIFLGAPPVKKPEGIFGALYGFTFHNDGKMYAILAAYKNVGKFGYAYLGNYTLSAATCSSVGGYTAVYDPNVGGFNQVSLSSTTATTMTALTPATYVDYDLLYLATQPFAEYGMYAYALLKKRTTQDVEIRRLSLTGSAVSGTTLLRTVTATSALLNAKVFGIAGYVSSAFYFSSGDNKVGHYNVSTGDEVAAAIVLPAGEKVVYLKTVYYYGETSYLMVLTSSNNHWKLYIYDTNAALSMPAATPTATYEGTGNASYVMSREANMPYNDNSESNFKLR